MLRRRKIQRCSEFGSVIICIYDISLANLLAKKKEIRFLEISYRVGTV